MNNRPLGVFDSGVGGLTVLKDLAQAFPNENFIYLGDTARLPYGSKSSATIRAYSEQVMNFLVKKKVKAIVIACNSASSQVSETRWKSIPVYSVIRPGAETAVRGTKNNRIGVLGTRATIESGTYIRAIKKLKPKARVVSQACPLFVPLAEEGWESNPLTDFVVSYYLEPVMNKGIDILILGCTHYPLLKKSIQKVIGRRVKLVDSGEAVAKKMAEDFCKKKINPKLKGPRTIQILMTDLSEFSERLTRKILKGLSIQFVRKVDI